MNDFYLVQRLSPPATFPHAVGFDRHFTCEYMGSTEFELGAIPASLKRLRAATITTTSAPYDNGTGATLHFVHATSNQTVVDDFMAWATDPKRPFWSRDLTYIEDALEGKVPYYVNTVAWWDISSDVLFTLNAAVARAIVTAIREGRS